MFNSRNQTRQARTNHQIRVPNVRVVKNGQQLGIMPTREALRLALDEGLDLVEVAPTARPPVCHIRDEGKHRYDEGIKEKENRKKQKVNEDKTIRFSPVTEDHDLHTKASQARSYLESGTKVRFEVKIIGKDKGRLSAHRELWYEVTQKMIDMLSDVSVVEMLPKMEGRVLICRLGPKLKKENK